MKAEEFKESIKRYVTERRELQSNYAIGQLTSLWTAYCLTYGKYPDIDPYDKELLEIWEILQKKTDKIPEKWRSFKMFKLSMRKYL